MNLLQKATTPKQENNILARFRYKDEKNLIKTFC